MNEAEGQYCVDKCVAEGLQVLCGCTDYAQGKRVQFEFESCRQAN